MLPCCSKPKHFRKPFHPSSRPLVRREMHFNGVLVTEQAFSKGAVETFNNSLIAVNFSAPAPNICFVIFHLLGKSAHEFARGVNLQHLRPFQRRAVVNLLKGLGDLIRIFRGQGFGLFVAAGNVGNGQRVIENYAPAGEFVARQKKKVRLVDRVGCGNIEFRSRNALRRGKVDLPKRLLDQPLFAASSETPAASDNFLMAEIPFQKPGCCSIFLQVWSPSSCYKGITMKSSKEPKGCVAQNKSPSAHEHEFTLFLRLAWLIEIRQIGSFGGTIRFPGCALL